MHKKQGINILLIANALSNNIAWHFLHNGNVFCLNQELTLINGEQTLTFSEINFKQKHIQQIESVVCLRMLSEKECEKLIEIVDAKTEILTNNIACFLQLKQRKLNVKFFQSKTDITGEENKLILNINEEFETEIFENTISFKTNPKIINETLSNLIINACVGAVNETKNAMFKFSRRKQIINLISECISLTNSVMLTVEKYHSFNFYKFLSGKKLFKKIKQHFNIFSLLYSLRKETFKSEDVAFAVKSLAELNFNNYVEIKNLNSLASKINSNNSL